MADYDPLDMDQPPADYDPLDLGTTTLLASKLTAAQARTDKRKQLCIQTLATTGNVTTACTAAGWARSTYYHHQKADKAFKALTEEALEVAIDLLEQHARNLAIQGVEEPIYQGGILVGSKTKYSERMVEILLKAHRPDKYRDNMKLEAAVTGGVLVVPGISSESDWEREAKAQQAEHRASQGDDDK